MPVDTRFGSFPENFAKFVRPTDMLNFDNSFVRKQSNELVRDSKNMLAALKDIHAFVASMPLGYDHEDWPASKILKKGRGQCNTKTTLFMALARSAGIPCKFHAWKVNKIAHKSHMPFLVYAFTPKTTYFTYPLVFYKKKWRLLSEAITSKEEVDWSMCPFDDAPQRKHPLKPEWIAEDLGMFWHPDLFYKKFGTNTNGWRKLAFPVAQLLLNR